MSVTQRNATRNQSTADYSFKKMFIFENRFESGLYTQAATGAPNSGNLQTGMLAARAVATPQKSTAVFAALTSGQTLTLGGLTFTAGGSGATAEAVAAAFSNLAVGAVDGPGTGSGAYTGVLAGFSTGGVINGKSVVFTSTTLGASTALAATGTGAAPAITTVAGTAGVAGGYIPVTAANIDDFVGITAMEGDIVPLGASATLQIDICTKGDIDSDMFVLPAGVTLDTVVGNKALRDLLEQRGFHLINGTVDHTKADN